MQQDSGLLHFAVEQSGADSGNLDFGVQQAFERSWILRVYGRINVAAVRDDLQSGCE